MSRTLFRCVVCGKITAGRQPFGESTIIFPRRHKVDGKPCEGNIYEAEMVDFPRNVTVSQANKHPELAESSYRTKQYIG